MLDIGDIKVLSVEMKLQCTGHNQTHQLPTTSNFTQLDRWTVWQASFWTNSYHWESTFFCHML